MEKPDTAERDRMITDHLGLVHHVARQLSRSLSLEADLDELVSSGTIGLMKALKGFDPTRGLAFSTFAAPRIRGAILDELRRQDHVPRSVRRKSRVLTTVRAELTRELGREPTDHEVADRLDIDVSTCWRWRAEAENAASFSLDRPSMTGSDSSVFPPDFVTDNCDTGIEDQVNLEQEVELLRLAILQLKEQERRVLCLYYYEDLRLHEIAAILELTESRVSQIRTKAIGKLRAAIAPIWEAAA
jgi:RNA polymerase sigma factor for flagellar operon FliA